MNRRPGSGYLRYRPAPRGAFDSARSLLLLALASLLAVVPSMLVADTRQVNLGLVACAVLAGFWMALYRDRVPALLVDIVDAVAFLVISVSLLEAWEVPGAMFASLWYRSLGASTRGLVVRVLLYSAVMIAGALTHGLGPVASTGPTRSVVALVLSVVPFWSVTAFVAGRLGRVLAEHDAVAAIGALETDLRAALIDEEDESTLSMWSRASWRALSEVVPGLRIALAERRRGEWVVVTTVGTWARPPVTLDARLVDQVPPLAATVGARELDVTPALDRAAGATCRWGSVELPDRSAVSRLMVGVPRGAGDGMVAAVAGTLSRSELVAQHLRDHLALGVQARRDELTGMSNRVGFFEVLTGHEDRDVRLSLVFLDLDGFKAVNDTYGHGVGDEVLRQTAARLVDACPAGTTCARLGGDEFAVLLTGADLETVRRVGGAIEAAISAPMTTSIGELRIGCSWGVACLAGGGDDTTGLLARADAAMYEMKRAHWATGEHDRRH
ncbi:MAG: GGDEF domain-containing protein [Actinobacteria bacterium]|nr:GGDEF domain-containing protein [Actinomycetota bacterium]MCG2801018.1 GGDEF domain-containing protein [Cellulomonas sp.]